MIPGSLKCQVVRLGEGRLYDSYGQRWPVVHACPGLIPGAYEYFTPLGHKDVEMEPGAKMS